MKLHGDLLSPFVRMSLVTAIECGLGAKVQQVTAAVKPQDVNDMLEKLSPIGKIPVLETDHGHAVYDSRVIMEYFCHVAGNKALLADEGAKHFRVLTSLALAQGIGDAAVALRYETFARPEAGRWPELAERQRARINAGLDEFERHVTETLEPLTLAAIAAACVLAYIDIRHGTLEWRKARPLLSGWYEGFARRDSMVATQPKT